MRRRIAAAILAATAALAVTPATAGAATAEECRRFGAEWKVCVWLLEPNPSGGRLYHVEICEGATCMVIEEPHRTAPGSARTNEAADGPEHGTEECDVSVGQPWITITPEWPFVRVGYRWPPAEVTCPVLTE